MKKKESKLNIRDTKKISVAYSDGAYATIDTLSASVIGYREGIHVAIFTGKNVLGSPSRRHLTS